MYNNPYAISKARLMDDLRPFDRTCTFCGKEIQVPYKWKDRVSVFCSQRCRNAHLKKKREERFKQKEISNGEVVSSTISTKDI